MRRPLLALGAALAAALAVAPTASAAAPPLVERAQAAIVVDARDGAVMFSKNPDGPRPIASTTKLMTALLALEGAKLTDVFTAPEYDALAAESQIHLRQGERMTVNDLLRALLLESANDAAETLAEGIAGSRSAFVREMNARAGELGLAHTHYANPVGLDEPGNHSTARDLAELSVRLLRRQVFARIVDMPEAVLTSGAHRRVVDNRNDLVARYPFVDGIKTGHTLEAGYVLVGAARRADTGVVSVVLGEPSEAARDADTLALLRWGLARFRRLEALAPNRPLARPRIKHRDERAELVPREAVSVTVRQGERLERRVRAPGELEGPIAAGTAVGSVTLLRDGKPIKRMDLVTARDVPGAGPLRIVVHALGLPLFLLLLLAIVGPGVVVMLRVRGRRGSGRARASGAR